MTPREYRWKVTVGASQHGWALTSQANRHDVVSFELRSLRKPELRLGVWVLAMVGEAPHWEITQLDKVDGDKRGIPFEDIFELREMFELRKKLGGANIEAEKGDNAIAREYDSGRYSGD
jgi:hypothetical protein